MLNKVVVPLTLEKVAYANKRLERLRIKLAKLERYDAGKGAIRSTKTAIKRWEDILAGKAVY